MQRLVNKPGPVGIRTYSQDVELIFDRQVFAFMAEELAKHPREEDGGKFIGYVLPPSETRLEIGHLGSWRIVVVDFLPGGPNARRSQVEFMPDGVFQEGLFRKAESRDEHIEHIGSWHSHHCNGLATLSEGDVSGYFATVNKQAYRLNFFVASLVKSIPRNPHSAGWIDHFLFVRGEDRYYKLTQEAKVLDIVTCFGDLTGHRPTSAHAGNGGRALLWYETDAGRAVLGEDRRYFAEHFGDNVLASRSNGRIKIKGGREAIVCVMYPLTAEQREVDLEITRNSKVVLSMKFDLEDRAVGYQAALSAHRLL